MSKKKEGKRPKVPVKGAEVFALVPGDKRRMYYFRAKGNEKFVGFRFPVLPPLREASQEDYGGPVSPEVYGGEEPPAA